MANSQTMAKSQAGKSQTIAAARPVGGTSAAKTNGLSDGYKSGTNGASHKNGSHAGNGSDTTATLLERAGVAPKWDPAESLSGAANRSEQFASFQVDAPSCDNCGAITVRNGNCYL